MFVPGWRSCREMKGGIWRLHTRAHGRCGTTAAGGACCHQLAIALHQKSSKPSPDTANCTANMAKTKTRRMYSAALHMPHYPC